MIGGRTRVFALLGNPVTHSLSPAMHNAAFAALGLDAVYLALALSAERVAPVMRALAEAGGGGNVTVPHKRVAAEAIGASDGLDTCNTFWGADGALHGADTDAIGIQRAWERLGAPGGAWLLLGTGGSARAAARAAGTAGAPILVRSRAGSRQARFLADCAAAGLPTAEAGQPVGMVVNCTPLGLGAGDPQPLAPRELPPDAAVLDLVYAAGETAWVRAARAAGRSALDGREVLLSQGTAAFRHWFPDVDPPAEVMRAALRARLG